MRIATFNLENLDDRARAESDFQDRLSILRPQFQRLQADVLCLQEVNANGTKHGPRALSALDALLAGGPYEGYHRVASLNRAGERHSDRHNLVILSRYPILEHRQVWHDHMAAPTVPLPVGGQGPVRAEWERPLLQAVLDLGQGRRLHVLNLHLRAPRAAFVPGQKRHHQWSSVGGWAEGFFLAMVKQAGQALEARLAVDAIFDAEPEAWIVVCGDLNAGEDTGTLRLLAGDEDDMGNPHLARRTLVPTERSLPDSQRFSVIHRGRRILLDHLLVSRPLLGSYRRLEIHNETLGDELVSPMLLQRSPESYHAPVVAEFEV